MQRNLYSPETEKNCISALLRHPEIFADIDSYISENDFQTQVYKNIFRVIRSFLVRGQEVNIILITSKLKSLNISFEEVPGEIYDHLEALQSVNQINEFVGMEMFKELKTVTVRREIAQTAQKIQDSMFNAKNSSVEQIIDMADKAYAGKISLFTKEGGDFNNIYDEMERLIEEGEPIDEYGMMGPFKRVNEIYGSLVLPGNITVIGARTGVGKAQRIDAKVLTPNGWTTMGLLKIKDKVIGSDGLPQTVTGVFKQGKKKSFRVIFNDGTSASSCDEHLWFTKSESERKSRNLETRTGSVKTLKKIMSSLKVGNRYNHSVSFVAPVQFSEKSLPLHPYILGAILADECYHYGNGINLRAHRNLNQAEEILKQADLVLRASDKKVIPESYLFGSIAQRTALLQGLLNANGRLVCRGSSKSCSIEYRTTSQQLGENFVELVRGLGGRAMMPKHSVQQHNSKTKDETSARSYFRIFCSFSNNIQPFRLQSKFAQHYIPRKCNVEKMIIDVKPEADQESVCISVDSRDHLYVTEDYILTHNTSFGFYYLTHIQEQYGVPILHLDMGEMSQDELIYRACAMFTKGEVPLHHIQTRKYKRNQEMVKKVREVWPRIKGLKTTYENIAGKSREQVISLIRRWYLSKVGRGNNGLIHLDYLKPFEDSGSQEYQAMGHFIQDVKTLITSEVSLPMWTSLQLNRQGITTGKRTSQIDDSENAFSISDRIVWQVSHAFLLRNKTPDEMVMEPNLGNAKMIPIKHRHLGEDYLAALDLVKMPDGSSQKNYIHLDSKNFTYSEIGDLKQVARRIRIPDKNGDLNDDADLD